MRTDGVAVITVSDSITSASEAARALLAGGLYVWSGMDGRTMRKNAEQYGFVYNKGERYPVKVMPELLAKIESAVEAMPDPFPCDAPRVSKVGTKRASGKNRAITIQRTEQSKVRTLRGGIEELLGHALDCIEAGFYSVQLDDAGNQALAVAAAVGVGIQSMDIASALCA